MVCIVAKIRAGKRGIWIPVEERSVSSLQNFQVAGATHPANLPRKRYRINIFTEVKRQWPKPDYTPHPVPSSRMCGL